MKRQKSGAVYYMVQAAMIAAIYVALTGAVAPVAFGPVQFRISEALCVLPYFTAAAVPGVSIGCLLSNLLFGAALPDVIFGTLATFLGAVLSYRIRAHKWLVCVPPILSNTIIIPWVLRYAYGSADLIPVAMLTVGIGEVLSIGVAGNLLLAALERYRDILFRKQPARNNAPEKENCHG